MQRDFLANFRRYLLGARGQIGLVIGILLCSLLTRLLLFHIPGCHGDLIAFAGWYEEAAQVGIREFYDVISFDYPPLTAYLFWVFGKLAHAIGPHSLSFLLRLPPNLFDVATAALIFYFLRQRHSFVTSLLVTTAYAFNPAIIFESAVWGQWDSVYTFFMVASLVAVLRSKYELSGGLLCLGMLVKPQALLVLPVVGYVILRNGGWKRALSSAAVFWATVLLVILPFRWDNPVTWLIDRYFAYDMFPYSSVNAYNFWALDGFWKTDTTPMLGLSPQMWGILAFTVFLAFVMWRLHRRYEPRVVVYAAFILMFGFFMLTTRMHERYLFPALALLAMAWFTRFTPLIYLGLTATFFANLAYVLSIINASLRIPDGHWSIFVLVSANAVLLALSLWDFLRMRQARSLDVLT